MEDKDKQEAEVNSPLREKESALMDKIEAIKAESAKKLIGQTELIEMILAALFCEGHILIEGVPGLAKTFAAKLLTKVIDLKYSRIQFTPDLMPSDIIGTTVFNSKSREFEFKKGPIFSNLVLIDEVNRAPAKTQSALFEAMEERQITADGITYQLPQPFLVLATQNPLEHEGTYKLPEAQLDRFLFKVSVNYPQVDQEVEILKAASDRTLFNDLSTVKKVLSIEEIQLFKSQINAVKSDVKLLRYIAQLSEMTRGSQQLFLGASPRASIGILAGAKAIAAFQGRDFISPEDIQQVLIPVLNHRLILTPEKEIEGVTIEQIIKEIIQQIEVPR